MKHEHLPTTLDDVRLLIASLRAEADRLEQGLLSRIFIADFGLSARATNALLRGGVHSVQALVSLTKLELLRLPNLGSGSVTEIENALALNSLRLREEARLMIECQRCGTRFVKDHQSRLFCSKACRTSSTSRAAGEVA